MLILLIHNDSTGTQLIANYDWELRINTTTLAQGRVEQFDRTKGAAKLVAKVSQQLSKYPTPNYPMADALMKIFAMERVCNDDTANSSSCPKGKKRG